MTIDAVLSVLGFLTGVAIMNVVAWACGSEWRFGWHSKGR